MRRVFVGLGFLLVAAFGVGLFQTRSVGQPAAAAPDTNHKKITVTGSATIPVKPDTARVSVAVRAMGNDFKTAVAECDKMGGEVEKALNALKLAGVEIKKGPINLINGMGGGVGFAGGIGGGIGRPQPRPDGWPWSRWAFAADRSMSREPTPSSRRSDPTARARPRTSSRCPTRS